MTQNPEPTALARVDVSASIMALVPTTLEGTFQLAQWLSKASFLPNHLRGKPEDTFAIMLAGYELGLPTMAALRGLYIVNGKPSLESKTKAALCISRGAAVWFKRTEYTATRCTWQMKRRDSGEIFESSYTHEEAKAAGLTEKAGPWKSYEKRMLSHRALGWLCDDACPDVTLGIGTAEDRYDLDDPDVIDAEFVDKPSSNFQKLAPRNTTDATPPADAATTGTPIAASEIKPTDVEKPKETGPATDEDRQRVIDSIAKLDEDKAAAEAKAKKMAEDSAAKLADEVRKIEELMWTAVHAPDPAKGLDELGDLAKRVVKLGCAPDSKERATLAKVYTACKAEIEKKIATAKAGAK